MVYNYISINFLSFSLIKAVLSKAFELMSSLTIQMRCADRKFTAPEYLGSFGEHFKGIVLYI